MKPFDALLSSAAGSTPVAAHFFGRQLVLHDLGTSVAVDQLIVSVGGMEQPELFLN